MNKFKFDKTMECLGFDKNDCYKKNEGETGIKILFPVFLKLIKVNINDSQFDIKPIY